MNGSQIDDGGTAFPAPPAWINGMSKREYFAAMAMQGILAGAEILSTEGGMPRPTSSNAARWATHYADALIAALKAAP